MYVMQPAYCKKPVWYQSGETIANRIDTKKEFQIKILRWWTKYYNTASCLFYSKNFLFIELHNKKIVLLNSFIQTTQQYEFLLFVGQLLDFTGHESHVELRWTCHRRLSGMTTFFCCLVTTSMTQEFDENLNGLGLL